MASRTAKAARILRERVSAAVLLMEAGDAARAFSDLLALRRDAGDEDAALLHALGRAAFLLNRHDLAVGFAGKAVQTEPRPEFYITLGVALLACGHVEPARAALRLAVTGAPDLPSARMAYAEALEADGQTDAAEEELREVVRLRPLEAGPRVVLGRFYERAGQDDAALYRYQEAKRLAAADDVIVRQHIFSLLSRTGRLAEAEAAAAELCEIVPGDPAALANHGAVLFTMNRWDEAGAVLERAVRLGTPTAETLTNLGLTKMALGDLISADKVFSEAAQKAPEDLRIALNRGTLLNDLGQREAAEGLFRRICEVAPESADAVRARFNLATVELAEGKFAAGWRDFEARRALTAPLPRPDLPDWDGQPTDKTVLLCGEQGLGDFLQFLRYVPAAAERAPVCLAVPETLRGLVRQSLALPVWREAVSAGRLRIVAAEDAACALRAPVLSLPFLLGLDEPFFPGAYLRAEAVARGARGRLRVGLCHAGSALYRGERRRSVPGAALSGLGAVPGVEWVSLQQGAAPEFCEPLPPGDMGVTAGVIASLDLVISVDTAIAHLAGAMGRPVWLLNRSGGDWRWAEGSRVTGADGLVRSLWYPETVIRDQAEPLLPEVAWKNVLERVAAALGEMAG